MAEFDVNVTIADNALAYSKIQQVSATDRLLGRSSAGAGDIEEIPCTAAGRALLDDADAAAQRATLELASGALVNVTPSFISYTGGSVGNAATTNFADIHSSAGWDDVQPGFYEIVLFFTHNANATTTGARFGLNGTAGFNFLAGVVDYQVQSTDRSSSVFQNYDAGAAMTSSLVTTGNTAKLVAEINITSAGNIRARFASELATANSITVTVVTGFLRRMA